MYIRLVSIPALPISLDSQSTMRHCNLIQQVLRCGVPRHSEEPGFISTSCVPTEIAYLIIAEAWSLSLSTYERINMMTSIPRVSREWCLIFHDITSKDIHIPCVSFYRHLLSTLTSGKEFTHHPKFIKAASHPCRSVGLMVDEEYTLSMLLSNKPGPTEASTSFLLGGMGNLLPNLRSINVVIRYPIITGMNVVPAGLSCGRIPAQVTDLNIRWETGRHHHQKVRLPRHTHTHATLIMMGSPFTRVRRLSIIGARDARLISGFVARCPRLRTLQVDAQLEPCLEHQMDLGGCTASLLIWTCDSEGDEVNEWEAHLVSDDNGLLTFQHVDSLNCDDEELVAP